MRGLAIDIGATGNGHESSSFALYSILFGVNAMPTLVAYKGLQVVSPDPTGDGGLAIQNDFKTLVDWSPKCSWSQITDPGTSNDQAQDYYPGSLWLRTNTTPPKLFVCQSSAAGAAVWRELLLEVLQDAAPKLGGDLDVNGHQLVSASNGNITFIPNGTGNVGIGTTTPTSSLTVSGAIATPVASKTAAYTLVASDSVVLCNATSGAFTVTLPTAVGISGRQYSIKRVNGGINVVTVAAASGETIDGASTTSLLTQYAVVTLVSDGANWLQL